MKSILIILLSLLGVLTLGCSSSNDNSTGEACGGLNGLSCQAGEYCQFEIGTCGAADQTGICTPLPEVCTEIYAPVCACDDTTYSSECVAAAAGVSILHQGECAVQ